MTKTTGKTSFALTAIALLIAVVTGCHKTDKCEDVDCFTPPQEFAFNIVDKTTGENVFATGEFNKADVDVFNENDQWTKHQFNNYGDTNLLILPEIGWQLERTSYIIHLSDQDSINFVLNMEERHENCCTFFQETEFDVTNHNWTEIDSTGVIRVQF